MKWIFIVSCIIIFFYFLTKRGNNKFWKLANRKPLQAYDFFINNDCWYVIHPNQNNSKPTSGDWSGPFFVIIPSVGKLRIYGKVGEFEIKQEEFIKLHSEN